MKNNSKPTNVADALHAATKQLAAVGIPSARLDSQILLGDVLGASRAWLLAHPEYALPGEAQTAFSQLTNRRAQWEPIAYILGHKEFFGRDFIITPGVLVPRAETEDLISLALTLPHLPYTVVDVGTGSGIIGITLQLERPTWHVTLCDIEPQALDNAQRNTRKFALDSSVHIMQLDLTSQAYPKADIIIANLPYVPNELSAKPDLRAEPPGALFSGKDGLSHYRSLWSRITSSSNKPSFVITEALIDQHAALKQLAHAASYRQLAKTGLGQLFKLRSGSTEMEQPLESR